MRGQAARGAGDRRPWWTLAAVSLGGMMVGLDGMALTIAAPEIADSVGTSFSDLQWLANAYLLALALSLFPAGRLADRIGRKRMFLAGVGGFGLVSLALAMSSSVWLLIVLRAVQGMCGAALQTGGQALLRATFPRERLAVVLGIWGAASMLAVAAGPMVGGVLVQEFDWQAIFEVNVPVAAVAVAIALWAAAESRGSSSTAILRDLRGLLRSRPLAVGAGVTALAYLGLFGLLFLFTLYLQNVRAVDPITAGLWLLPVTGTLVISAPLGGILTARWGPRWPMAAGMVLVAAGVAGFGQLTATSGIAAELLPAVLLGLGAGVGLIAATEAIMGNAPVEHAGLAAALHQTVTQLGGVIGIVILGATMSWQVAGSLGPAASAQVVDQVAQGHVTGVAGGTAAFLSGFELALLVGAALVILGAVIAVRTQGRPRESPRPVSRVPTSGRDQM